MNEFRINKRGREKILKIRRWQQKTKKTSICAKRKNSSRQEGDTLTTDSWREKTHLTKETKYFGVRHYMNLSKRENRRVCPGIG